MAKNMKVEEFLKVVIEAISREFDKKVKVKNIGGDGIRIVVDSYKVSVSMKYLEEIKSPYGIDRYILESLEREGFSLDRNRSQYIQYCFGVYNGTK